MEEKELTQLYPNEKGYFGSFGGAFIPEMLHANVQELQEQYLAIMGDTSFQEELQLLLHDYAGRPTPLYYAKRLSEKYKANIYLKREDLCHTGAHKVNNTIGQVLLAERLGKKKIIAETGAGQHGVATATVCALKGLECKVFMGELDIQRQAPNVGRMKLLGAEVIPAMSGNRTLKDATNEALRYWINHASDTHYIIGSVVGPHPYPDMVARFQSVISEEIRKQLLEKTGNALPNKVIACVGGGSNATGAFFNYIEDDGVELIAAEAAGLGIDSGESAAATFLGKRGVLHGSMTTFMQTDDGQVVEPYSISAGMDYPGIGPALAHWFKSGRVHFEAVTDDEALVAGMALCKTEGIIPAIESSHALAVLDKIDIIEGETIVINLSGRGDKDLETYIKYQSKVDANVL
ncbi:tryptophan synthase subunit beta [Reichenbachiella sp. MALMAid0571]|uniref:tryptophan synthase subunit beta n=1 Tax=Reichenbachiella sp. MALMAid0571 TaxID=3143939 RepID=UPI0032DEE6CB